MLIRSQSKLSLVVLDSVAEISVVNDCEICAFHGQGYVDLGTYSTEEKAVKVLDMIQEHQIQTTTSILDYGSNGLTNTVEEVKNKVFQMPQDDEVEV